MNFLNSLKDIIVDNRSIRLVEEGIYSVLPDSTNQMHYDKRAVLYDLIVGTNLYHKLMWGTVSQSYTEFAKQAIKSMSNGILADAGCGSLLFTAQTYIESDKQVIAFDQSLEMLKRARKSIIKSAGHIPERIILLQADLHDVPFRPASFDVCLSLNVVHMFDNADELIKTLSSLINRGGRIFVTSLVRSGRLIGDLYLNLLYEIGEVGRPKSETELKETMEKYIQGKVSYKVDGNMAYATAFV